MSWIITGTQKLDPDAAVYIDRVEAADGQSLETAVKDAINAFVVGCKTDGTWAAIKASCIMAGARTLSGALVPLVGTAPTNYNFVAGDYNRKTGLVGGGGTKYLDSNRANNADPQDSKHLSIYKSVAPTNISTAYIASQITSPVNSASRISDNVGPLIFAINSGSVSSSYTFQQLGFLGVSRPDSGSLNYRANTTTIAVSSSSNFNANINTFVFARNVDGSPNLFTDARLAFYSIGESLNLALLDARVTTLMSDLAAAIP